MDGVIFLGFSLMVVGLGIKLEGANKTTSENSFVSVEKNNEAIEIMVNINTATSVELESLPSIGPVMARRIIDYRNKYGKFGSKLEIKNVLGIGEKTYEKLKDKIRI
ncbi:MAG TPA: ComEA family DNA-binding protein [Candidatus Methanoperedens sp.]|nr:ComEA family DNA-binding protein [Candidatus Methanoperedens sp.]